MANKQPYIVDREKRDCSVLLSDNVYVHRESIHVRGEQEYQTWLQLAWHTCVDRWDTAEGQQVGEQCTRIDL